MMDPSLTVMQVGSNYAVFLEKIADMFESIAHTLPQYQQLHESCKHQLHFQSQSQDARLAALMSYVYADMIQFCLDLYRMLSRGHHGTLLFTYENPAFWNIRNSRLKIPGRRFPIRKCLPFCYGAVRPHPTNYFEPLSTFSVTKLAQDIASISNPKLSSNVWYYLTLCRGWTATSSPLVTYNTLAPARLALRPSRSAPPTAQNMVRRRDQKSNPGPRHDSATSKRVH